MLAANKYRYVIGAVVLILIVYCGFRTYPPSQTFNSFSHHGEADSSSSSKSAADAAKEHTDALLREHRIAKASMLYGAPNDVFERALKSHDKHNDRFGYPFAVMRQEITKGYWTKLSYLLSLIVLELGRPADERIEWIMWNDADAVVLNPEIPLSIFLPPSDPQFSYVNFIGSRHNFELDARSFFLRVDPWSVTFLVKAMAVPLIDEGAELGHQMDQNAMAFILNETEFRNNVFYQPNTWFNALRHTDRFEGQQGTLLAGFSGDELKGERWRLMDEMVAETEQKKYEQPLEETNYTKDIQQYWDLIREARTAAADAEAAQKKIGENIVVELMGAWEWMKEILYYEAYDTELMKAGIERIKKETEKVRNAPKVEPVP